MSNVNVKGLFSLKCIVIIVIISLLAILLLSKEFLVQNTQIVISTDKTIQPLSKSGAVLKVDGRSNNSSTQLQHAKPFLGDGIQTPFFNNISLSKAQTLVHEQSKVMGYKCKTIERVGGGKKFDGAYSMCVDPAFKPQFNSCLAYSFGIAGDWRFDEQMNSVYGCEVHSFDPSIGLKDHMHKPNIYFHNLGVWGSNYHHERGWTMKNLATIIKDLGHTERTIDMLKYDVEGAEWSLTRHIVDSGVFAQIKQIAVEWHTPAYRPSVLVKEDFSEVYATMRDFYGSGFQMYVRHESNGCCTRFSDFGNQPKCCYEGGYINNRFIQS